jgi:hypothetical protein
MRRIKHAVEMVMAALFLFSWNIPCFGAESGIGEILKDTSVGTLASTLVGAAVIAFAKNSGDQNEYPAIAAESGVQAGNRFKFMRHFTSVTEYENGRMKLGIPFLENDIRDPNDKCKSEVVFIAKILQGKF